MKSAAYYVRKGLRTSIRYFLKHPQRIILFMVMEMARLISLPLVFLIPAFSKMQFNYTKMIFETGEASYSKSFDDADKKPAYLNRLLFTAIFFFVSISIGVVIFGFLFLIIFLVRNIITNVSGEVNSIFSPVVNAFIIFAGILTGLIFIYALINFWVGNFISCASNDLSLGDIFYNTLLTMRKNVGKIMITFLLYFLMAFSLAFLFGFPLIILYAALHNSNMGTFNIILAIFIALFAVIFVFLYPIFKTAFDLSMYEICDICAELDSRVVVVTRRDLRGNSIKVNVLPYEEKSKRLSVDLKDLPLKKQKKKEIENVKDSSTN